MAQQPPADDAPLLLRGSRLLGAPAQAGAKPALVIGAGKLAAQVDQTAEATDGVELRYGELVLRADKLH
ncbi:hypothetical protein, partial [Klebsiella pneumoniae]|uniref:hypothetical protein n=1 Tax=Klebsiella pneumoniae TaxID=573 RepID=UPI0013D31CFB